MNNLSEFRLFRRPAQVGAEEPADRRSQVKSDINLKENAQGLIYVYVTWLGIFRKLANIVKLQKPGFLSRCLKAVPLPQCLPSLWFPLSPRISWATKMKLLVMIMMLLTILKAVIENDE